MPCGGARLWAGAVSRQALAEDERNAHVQALGHYKEAAECVLRLLVCLCALRRCVCCVCFPTGTPGDRSGSLRAATHAVTAGGR